jgi:hypothetical protein
MTILRFTLDKTNRNVKVKDLPSVRVPPGPFKLNWKRITVILKPALTPDFCLHVVINSTPSPSRFRSTDDPSTVALFDLGVVNAITSAIFVQGVKSRIFPWHIDDSMIASSRETKLQAAAASIQAGAF